jgi:hypothetical protein
MRFWRCLIAIALAMIWFPSYAGAMGSGPHLHVPYVLPKPAPPGSDALPGNGVGAPADLLGITIFWLAPLVISAGILIWFLRERERHFPAPKLPEETRVRENVGKEVPW